MHATPPNLPRLFFLFAVSQAYYLYNAANDRDYGQESIEILLNVMEQNTEDLIVVLAGALLLLLSLLCDALSLSLSLSF